MIEQLDNILKQIKGFRQQLLNAELDSNRRSLYRCDAIQRLANSESELQLCIVSLKHHGTISS